MNEQQSIRLGPEVWHAKIELSHRGDLTFEDFHEIRYRGGCVHIQMHDQTVYSYPLRLVISVKTWVTRENEHAA
jgi:hypothetical protein